TGAIMAAEIIGNYRLQNCMMSGQTSQVWEVVEISSHRHFAMKLLLPEKAKDSESRRLLFHEAEVGKKLVHPNVIRITDLSRDLKTPYFVMEYFPAGSLKLRIVRKDFAFVKERAHSIFKQAATGFAYMNASGWLHRDIKPDNMLVSAAGELRIIDLALCQRIQPNTFFNRLFRRRGKAQGTRTYMSPEQIRDQILDQRADIYSFGATAYELVAQRPPFRGATQQDLLQKQIVEKPITPQTYNPDITDEFAALILRMLAKKREDRPKDFHEILMALRTMRIFKSDPLIKPEH
ncbi:MAG TPA: serine/threonine-protein kinase, partial [Gemmataceae bacterium]|nr:serine/threonine-protein kinase [Gemmataceae bacterium]